MIILHDKKSQSLPKRLIARQNDKVRHDKKSRSAHKRLIVRHDKNIESLKSSCLRKPKRTLDLAWPNFVRNREGRVCRGICCNYSV